MNYVEPIRDVKKIARMKKLMRKEGKLKELVLFEIGIKTGLRISDILNLKWSSVAGQENGKTSFKSIISLKEIKTRKSKQFHLSENVRAILEEYHEKVNPSLDELIFKSKANNVKTKESSWTRQYVWLFLNDYCYRVGIRNKVGTHTLRKTFGYHA
jgi:integrase